MCVAEIAHPPPPPSLPKNDFYAIDTRSTLGQFFHVVFCTLRRYCWQNCAELQKLHGALSTGTSDHVKRQHYNELCLKPRPYVCLRCVEIPSHAVVAEGAANRSLHICKVSTMTFTHQLPTTLRSNFHDFHGHFAVKNISDSNFTPDHLPKSLTRENWRIKVLHIIKVALISQH